MTGLGAGYFRPWHADVESSCGRTPHAPLEGPVGADAGGGSGFGRVSESRGCVCEPPRVGTVEERESCEALTSRFARLNDFLVQRIFRTLDQVELADEGTVLDRLQRAEARGLIDSAHRWREIRLLRNAIAHDYLIESADTVLADALAAAPELAETVQRVLRYVTMKRY